MARKKDVLAEEYVDSVDDGFVEEADVSIVGESKEDKVSKRDAYLESYRKAKELSAKAKDEFKKAEYELLRSDAYSKMDCIISMVVKGVAISGIIYGRGGTGKTYRMKQLLKDVNYEVIMTKLTAKALYCLLYEYRDADIIWFDDVTKIMKDPLILGFLKSICGDGNSEASKIRTVQYNVSTPIKNADGDILPDNFDVSARILITTNEMPNTSKSANLDLGAVLSRMKKAKLELPRPELLKIFEEIIVKSYGELSLSERREVLKYLVDNTTDKMSMLNLRTLFDAMDYRRIAKIDGTGDQWMMNILEDLGRDPTSVALEKLLQEPNFHNETERRDAFDRYLVSQGRKTISKATYNRMKAKLVDEFGIEPAEYLEKVKPEKKVESSSDVLPSVDYVDE